METFFKPIKAELIWRHSWQTRRAVEAAIFEYINGFYNPRRRHSALGWKPIGFRTNGSLNEHLERHETGTGPVLEVTLELHEPSSATPLTPDKLLGLKAKHITNRGELNELEGANIVEGLTWLERRPKSFDLLTNVAAREVHKRLFGKVWGRAGVYRLTEKNMGVPVWHITTEMRTCLDDACNWRENGTFELLEAAARLHHKLVWVHPFANGNGRRARIMADAYLAEIDKDIFLDWSGGGTLVAENDHRTRYIFALKEADGYEFGALIEFAQ